MKKYFFKRVFLSAVTLVMAVAILSACGKSSAFKVPDNYLNFQSKNYDYSIAYPPEWKSMTSDQVDFDVMFVIPGSNPNDIANTNVNILVQDGSLYGLNLDEFKEYSFFQMKQELNNVNMIQEATKVKMGSEDAYEWKFSCTENDLTITYYQIFSMKDNNIYILSYAAPENQFENNLEAVKIMAYNFNFGK